MIVPTDYYCDLERLHEIVKVGTHTTLVCGGEMGFGAGAVKGTGKRCMCLSRG
jgi:hypothetical protein